ncbi:MAG: methionine adenosyltransferase domain-containing protein, partial [Armatimonadaceae bacterium]
GWLPPEHFLARRFASDVVVSFGSNGPLAGHGPDGKVVVCIDEDADEWRLCSVLASVVQLPGTSFVELLAGMATVLEASWATVCRRDRRWYGPWQRVDVRLNPGGGWTEGGPLCDNGQTGRKTVMDHYGPRIPVGGGSLSGKDPWQVDRVAQSLARKAALHAVGTGARECLLTVAYGPGANAPLSVSWDLDGAGEQVPDSHWDLGKHSPADLLPPCAPIEGNPRRG